MNEIFNPLEALEGYKERTISGLPDYELDEAKEYCKKHIVDILGLKEDAVGGYICPVCGSGSGPHGTGMTTQDDGIHWRCWRCGETRDVFDMLAAIEEKHGDKYKGENKFEKVYNLAGLTNMTSEERDKLYQEEASLKRPGTGVKSYFKNSICTKDKATVVNKNKDYSEFYNDARTDLKCSKDAIEYLHSRGLSDTTIEQMQLGYQSSDKCRLLREPKSKSSAYSGYPVIDGYIDTTNDMGAIVIPISNSAYVLRNLNKEASKRYAYPKGAYVPIYLSSLVMDNEPGDIFIVEGFFDAMSFIEIGFKAIALGTMGSPQRFEKLIKNAYGNGFLDNKRLIICEDNDAAGQEGLKRIVNFLETLPGIQYAIADPCKGIADEHGNPLKDANDALVYDRERFKKNILEAQQNEFITVKGDAPEHNPTIPESTAAEDTAVSLIRQLIAKEPTSSKESLCIKPTVVEGTLTNVSTDDTETPSSTYHPRTALDVLTALEEDDGTKFLSIPTGLKELDELLDGGLRTGLYGLAGLSGLGKSTLALQICDSLARQGYPVLFISLEMSDKDLVCKSLARLIWELECDKKAIRAERIQKSSVEILTKKAQPHAWNEEECKAYDSALLEYKAFANNVYICEGGLISTQNAVHTVAGIKDQLIPIYAEKKKYPVVIVDYVQKLRGANANTINRTASEKQVIDESVYSLRQLATKYSIPVIGLLSMNRASYASEVSLSSAKGSGDIEYSCDVLLGLDIPEDEKKAENMAMRQTNSITGIGNPIKVTLVKNRYGVPNKYCILDFYGKQCCYMTPFSGLKTDNIETNPFLE